MNTKASPKLYGGCIFTNICRDVTFMKDFPLHSRVCAAGQVAICGASDLQVTLSSLALLLLLYTDIACVLNAILKCFYLNEPAF